MPEAARHRPAGSIARIPILVALMAVVVAGGLIDRVGAARSSVTSPVGAVPVVVAAPDGALSSSWFCAGATGTTAGAAGGTVLVANTGTQAARGKVTIVGSDGRAATQTVDVAPGTRSSVPERLPRGAPYVGAIVDMDAGAVAVEQQVAGDEGSAVSACATSGSADWYFATGETLINASEEISLLNPYPTDAIVDLSFTTDQGFETPDAFQGLDIPAGGMTSVDLGTHLRRRHAIAVSVTARTGRVVAWKTEVVTPPASGAAILGTPAANNPLADPAAAVAGVTVTLGSPALSDRLVWADGVAGGGLDEQYVIYNPSNATADLSLSVNLDHGVAEPFALSVGPDEVATVVSDQEARIPPGVGHSAVLVSTNHVPVIAERTIAGTSAAGYPGLGEMPGQMAPAADWVLPTGEADSTHRGTVVIYNPGRAAARVLLEGYQGGQRSVIEGGASLLLGPGRRATVSVNGQSPQINATPLVVESSAPVYVELTATGAANTPGVSISAGIPLAP